MLRPSESRAEGGSGGRRGEGDPATRLAGDGANPDSGLAPLTSHLSPKSPPPFFHQLRIWTAIGVQSWGGGTATLTLIRRAVVEQRDWISAAEFTRDWSLCQLAPGINLVAFAILLGRRFGGAAGVLAALVGMLTPSVAITVLITAGFSHVHGKPAVQAALHGIIPATVGLGLATGIGMARPLLTAGNNDGRVGLALSFLLLTAGGLAVALWRIPVLAILCGAGAVYALFLWRLNTLTPEHPNT